MFATKKALTFDWQSDDADGLALCAARIYWLAMVLMERVEDASALTRQVFDLLLNGERGFDSSLARWACTIAVKTCIAKKQAELAADQRDASAWNQAVDDLELDYVQPLCGLSLESIQKAVMALPALPRFMFVLNVLERYTLEEAGRVLQLDKKICDAALAYGLAALTEIVHSSELSTWIESHSLA